LLAPKLGNAVEIGCGAAIIGGITVGDHVRIGPNAVVTTNIPGGVAVLAPDSRVAVSKKFWSYNI
jgi:serine O-acetyltransferase